LNNSGISQALEYMPAAGSVLEIINAIKKLTRSFNKEYSHFWASSTSTVALTFL